MLEAGEFPTAWAKAVACATALSPATASAARRRRLVVVSEGLFDAPVLVAQRISRCRTCSPLQMKRKAPVR